MRITSGFSKKFFEEDAVFEVMDNLVFDDTKLSIYFISANYDQQKVSNGVREYLNKVAFRNERTYLHVNGSVLIDASVLILMEIDMPFEVGYTINYTPTPFTMKITDANFKKRLVKEIDYTPIVNIYGKLSGKDASELNFYDLMSNPLGVSYNNQVFLRSPIRVNSDGSMSFQCFLKEGQEVIRMHQQSMVKELEELIRRLERKLGNVECLLVFNCAYRYLEMLRDKTSYNIKSVFNGIDMIGMNSFGQQLNGMHMNQSLTYIAFGSE